MHTFIITISYVVYSFILNLIIYLDPPAFPATIVVIIHFLYLLQVVTTYSCKRKTARWPLKLFYNLLDVSAYNGFVLWTNIDPS